MKSKEQEFIKIDKSNFPNLKNYKIGIVVSEWNKDITSNLLSGAKDKLTELGVKRNNVSISWVPGSFELVYGCKELSKQNFNVIIAIGCIIKGETDHYDYICQAVSNGVMNVSIKSNIPVLFGVLTCQNSQLAFERSRDNDFNKGFEVGNATKKLLALDL